MECISSQTKEHCTCTCTACDKHGHCCKCVAHHRDKGEIPGCFFTPGGERLWDRSLARFIEDRSR